MEGWSPPQAQQWNLHREGGICSCCEPADWNAHCKRVQPQLFFYIATNDSFVQLTGVVNDGSQRFRFTCSLTCFVTTANDLSRTLAPFIDDPNRFLEELKKACDGGITCIWGHLLHRSQGSGLEVCVRTFLRNHG